MNKLLLIILIINTLMSIRSCAREYYRQKLGDINRGVTLGFQILYNLGMVQKSKRHRAWRYVFINHRVFVVRR